MQLDPTYLLPLISRMGNKKKYVLRNRSEFHKYLTCNTAVHGHDSSKKML
jgi:hypothetical protein